MSAASGGGIPEDMAMVVSLTGIACRAAATQTTCSPRGTTKGRRPSAHARRSSAPRRDARFSGSVAVIPQPADRLDYRAGWRSGIDLDQAGLAEQLWDGNAHPLID